MGSHVYYFDYYEEDQHDNIDNGFVHNKNTKTYQRQQSSGGPTSYIKPRRPPPPVPRQLPRPRPGNQRQPNYTQNNSTPSFPRTPSVPYRLYSISEKEEEIYGERRKIMSEQKPQYKSSDSLLAKASFTDLSTAQTDHHGSMPDMSSSGKLKQKEDKDISADEMENTSTFLYQNNQDTTLDKYSFIDTEPQHTSMPVQKEANVFDFLHSDIQEDEIDEPTLIPEQISKGTRLEQEKFVVHIHGNHKQARIHSVQKQSAADNSARFISTNKMDKPNEKGIKKVIYMKSQSESKMGNFAGVKSKNRWTTRSLDNQVGSDTVFEEDEEEEEEEGETSNKRTTDGFSLLQHVKTALAITDEPRDAEDTEALPELSQEMGEIMGDESGTSLSKSEMDNRRQKFVPRVPSPLTYENTSEIWDGENVSEMNSPNLEKKICAEEQKVPAGKRKLQNVEINERRGEFFNTIRRGSLGSHLPGSSEYELSNRTIQNIGRQHSKSVMIPGYEEGQFAELYQIFSSPDSNERRVEDFSTARKGSIGSQVSESSENNTFGGAKNSLKQEQLPDHHTLNTMNKKLGEQNVEIRERRGNFPNTVKRGSLGSHLPGSSEYGLSNSTIQNTGRQRSKSVALPGYDEGQFAGLHQLFSSPDTIERRGEDFSTIRKGSLSGQVSGKSENNTSDGAKNSLKQEQHPDHHTLNTMNKKLGDQNVEIRERRGEFPNSVRRGSLGSHLPGSSEYGLSNSTIQNTGRQRSKSVALPGYDEGQFAGLHQLFSSPDTIERRVEDFSTIRKGSLSGQVSGKSENNTSDGAKNSLKQEQHPDHHTLNTMNKKLGDQNVEIRERRGEFPNTVRRGSLGSHLPGSSEYGLSNSTIQNTGRQRSKSVALPGYDEGQFAGLHQLFSSPDTIERRVEDFSTIRKGSLSGQVSGKSENNTSDGAKNSLKQEQHPDHHTLNTMNKKLGDQNVEIRERRGEFPNTVRRGSLGSHLPGSSEYGLSNSTIQNTGRQRSKSVALPGYFFSSPDTNERRGEDFSIARQGSLGSQVSETSEYESLNNTTQSRFLEKYTFDDSGKKLYQELHPNTLKTTNKKLGERQIQKSIVMPMECDSTWEYSPFNDKNSYNQSIKEDSDEYEQSVVSCESPSILGAFEHQQTSVKWNPNFQAYSSQEILESIDEEPSNESISVEDLHMEKIINEKTSINQFFWTLYFSNPNIMQGYLDVDTWAPSQTAVNLLSELYLSALDCLANYNEDTEEGRYTSGIQKKRTLPHSPTSTTTETRSFFMEKEVMESQNRKFQMEISTLTTENKLMKEKYNRATAKINDLEEELHETKEELESVQLSVNQEVSDIQRRSKSEVALEIEQLNYRITSLVHENEALKSEVLHIETQLQAANDVVEMARHNIEKNKTVDAFKIEVTSLKEEVTRLKSLLEQSEHHLQEEEIRRQENSQQVINLTEMKHLLQQQVDLGGGGNTVVDKQIKSLEKRLRVTEERLHHERSDRANNLSQVEDKLLTENARLQAAEKELSRQLQREKDKNRNLEQKIRDVRNENEKLRLQVPFDEASLSSEKYDIPYSTHSSQRHESVKSHDFKHIATQIEQQAGIRSEKDMVCHLWSTREQAYNQLRQWEIMLQDLNLRDNDATEGLKNLRDLKCQYEMKLKQAEEKAEDSKSEKLTFESTYKEQLATLVKERHEAFAKLKTAEDLLEATRSENEILRKNLPALSTGAVHSLQGKDSQKEAMQIQIQNLESKVQLLTRSNQMMEGEMSTLKVQIESREKTLKDVEGELQLANSRLELNKSDDRKQQKNDKLTLQVNSLQAEIELMNDNYNRLLSDNNSLEKEIADARKDLKAYRSKQKVTKAEEMADSRMSFSVKEDLEDKNRQIKNMVEELSKLDTELQQSKQDLQQEQILNNDYESQIESLQQQFEERGRIIDAISQTEEVQLGQYKVLKVTLDSVNSELKEKERKIKIQEVELSQYKDKVQQLTLQLDAKEMSLPDRIQVEVERDQLKEELLESYSNMKTKEEEMQEMATEIQQLQQETTNQKVENIQLTSEKGELEQHLEEIAEELDALIQEKAQSEEDIVKLESKLQELVETLGNEAQKQHDNFQHAYEDIPPVYKPIAEELETIRSLLQSKDKELDMLQTKASRQQMDIDFLQRRIELLHNDNQSNREDIARMTNQLIFKTKESFEARQLCEYLSGERVNLQKEVSHLGHDLEKERSQQAAKQTEIEKSEYSKKESVISSLEISLQQVRKTLQDTEYENVQLRHRIEDLTEDQRKLMTLNASLETKMETEKKLFEERQQEVMSVNHKLDLLQREHDHVLNNLNTEKQVKEKLNNDYQIYSSENHNLRRELHDVQIQLEDCQRQLISSQETVNNVKKDKGVMYHEYENMVKRMSEKDQRILELQTKLDITVADMERELHLQKHSHALDKTSTEKELDIQKEQVSSLNAEMKAKQSELSTFGRTLQELEEITTQKKNLEMELHVTKGSVDDLKLLLDSHKKEILSLQESLVRYQESVSKAQMEKAGVEDALHRLNESSTSQIQDLNKTITEIKSANDGEKFYLKDNLSQTQSKIQSLESSLGSVIESRDKLQVEYRMSQRLLEEAKEHLQEETAARKISEQSADSLESQLHESRKERFLTEEKSNQAESSVITLERELKLEKDRLKHFVEKCQELEATSYSHETSANTKQEQMEVLQNEVSKLKQILESQKLQFNAKLKKSAQEMSQQMELIELDRNKLSQQNTQLFADLDKSRETVQNKNKENLKLQEEMLLLHDQVKELSFKLKHSDESRKTDEEMQSKLQTKLQEQEDELKRVKNFLAKKAEESGDAEKSVWHEMNKMIQDMSKQMSMHLESQKVTDKDSKDRDSKVIQRYKKQIHDLNTELQTERALHKITAASLQSLEEDCVRLRQQYQAMRRRNNSASDKKYKSRMEAINEIIARSQTQAQAMLSSGNYLDDSLKSLASPRVTFDTSPDNSICSDMSFNSTIAVHNESSPKNTRKSTPKKS